MYQERKGELDKVFLKKVPVTTNHFIWEEDEDDCNERQLQEKNVNYIQL